MRLGSKIKELRLRKNVTQEQLAKHFLQAEKFLMDKYNAKLQNEDYSMMLSWLYNCMADSYRCKAEKYAKIAIRTAPVRKYNHTLLRMAQQGNQLDWNFSNHSKQIDYYKRFVKEYPDYDRGYALLGDCMAGHCEYERAISYYNQSIPLQKSPKYTDSQISIATIYEIMGKREEAINAWKEVLNILNSDYNIVEDDSVDEICEEIRRLEDDEAYRTFF